MATTFYYNDRSPTTVTDSTITSSSRAAGTTLTLTSVDIGTEVTSIGDFAFQDCTGLTSIIIPSSVTSIRQYAFYNCGLTSITIPNSVTSLGYAAFISCDNLTSAIIGNGITTFRAGFALCSNLSNVSLPNTLIELGNDAFSGCTNLANIALPKNLNTIKNNAFYSCTKLNNITIPSKVTTIENLAFYFCTDLTRINFLGTPPTLGSDVFTLTNAGLKIYRYSTKSGWSSTFGGKDVLLIDVPIKGLRTFGFSGLSLGKISIKKQNLGGGKITSNENYILNSKFDADNQYPIADGSLFFDSNDSTIGNCNEIGVCTILTNYTHNSPLFYEGGFNYHTFANRTFHEINAPYNILPIGHPIQPRLLKMFGAGTKFGRNDNLINQLKTITNTTSFSPNFDQSWAKYGVEQIVSIPSWATKVVYGVKYLAKNDDLFRDNNFAGLKLNFRLPLYAPIDPAYRNYVNVHLIRRSTASEVDTLESLYGSNAYLYFDADSSSNAMGQWLGQYVTKVKVRKRSSTIIDANTDSFIKIKDTVDIPTFSSSSAQPDFGNGRPGSVSLEMFFAEWNTNMNDDQVPSGSIYFYEPFIYFV
jgi:hypothetical protein